jgi:hypothetical protein
MFCYNSIAVVSKWLVQLLSIYSRLYTLGLILALLLEHPLKVVYTNERVWMLRA